MRYNSSTPPAKWSIASLGPEGGCSCLPRVLILAYGNPLRSDDGVAWRAAELLRAKLSLEDAEIVCTHQLTPEFAESAAHVDRVIFIDAEKGDTPGQVRCHDDLDEIAGSGSSHFLTPSQLLALGEVLYGSRPKHFVVSIAGENFEHGDSLSAVVENALPQLVQTVVTLVTSPVCSTP